MSGFSLAALKNTLDEVRVSVYAKNETEKKVYEALSSKNWGASSTMLNDIAADTSDYEKFGIINEIVWASLETDGKSWKQIFKSLTLIEFLIKNGSERFIEASRDKLFKIKRLQDYNFYEGTIDKGSGCREKAKQIVELLSSNEIIRAEREKARALRNKFGGVGSDSARGGGGGGSYGGSSYGGNSDSYSSGGGGGAGAGGRYGGDSYGNDRYNNDRSGSGGNGGNSYNDRGGSSANTGRYGGGAYDSDKPPRYGDDAPAERYDSNSNTRRSSQYDRNDDEFNVDDVKPYKPASKDPSSSTATGGKLKVSIRKSVVAPAAPAPAPVAEVNLIGDDFDAFETAPAAPAPAPAGSNFDPFGMAPPVPAAAPVAAAFDPFGMSAPAPAAPAFDPFGASPAAPAVPAFDPFNQPQYAAQPQYAQQQPAFPPQQQNFPPQAAFQQQQGFSQAPLQQQQFQQFQQAPPQQQQFQQSAPQQPQQQQQQFRANPPPAAQAPSDDADFGDFEVAKPAAPVKAAPVNKWGDLGSLVDLGGISKNQAPAAKNEGNNGSNVAYASSSFAGLDGFNKTPQNMQAGSRPMGGGGYGGGAPGQPSMAPRGTPMGYGGAPAPGGYGGPAAPMGYGAPAAPMSMGYGGQPNPTMGYGAPAPQMGGYGAPNPNMGYGAPRGGAPMGSAPMGSAPMGGAPMGGAPMGGAPMGGYPGAPGPAMGGMGGMGGAPGYPPQQGYRPAGPGGFGGF